MEGRTLTLTNTVRVDIINWNEVHEQFVSFETQEAAAFFWAIREDIVPRFSEEICFLSQDPNSKKWFLIDHLIEDKEKKELTWKNAWIEGRQKYGKEVWKSYYKGVRDQQNDSVYDKGYGQKFYFPEIK